MAPTDSIVPPLSIVLTDAEVQQHFGPFVELPSVSASASLQQQERALVRELRSYHPSLSYAQAASWLASDPWILRRLFRAANPQRPGMSSGVVGLGQEAEGVAAAAIGRAQVKGLPKQSLNTSGASAGVAGAGELVADVDAGAGELVVDVDAGAGVYLLPGLSAWARPARHYPSTDVAELWRIAGNGDDLAADELRRRFGAGEAGRVPVAPSAAVRVSLAASAGVFPGPLTVFDASNWAALFGLPGGVPGARGSRLAGGGGGVGLGGRLGEGGGPGEVAAGLSERRSRVGLSISAYLTGGETGTGLHPETGTPGQAGEPQAPNPKPQTPKQKTHYVNRETGEVVAPSPLLERLAGAVQPGREKTHLLRVAVEGGVVRSVPVIGSSHKPGPGGRRGRIRHFSKAARSRMIEHVNLYKRKIVEKMSIFITLTYPGAYPATKEAKRHLDNFIKRLRRKFPKAGGVWRLEWQERGAPHFHLLVFGVRFIPWQWVAQAWYEVCGEVSPEHLKAGTETRRARSRKEAFYYLSKYLAKTTQDAPPVGKTMTPEQLAACVAPGVAVPGVTDGAGLGNAAGPLGDAVASSAEEQAAEEGPGRLWGHWGEWQRYQSEMKEVLIEVGDIAKVARTLDKLRQAEFRAKDGTRKRKRVGRKKFVDRHARWYVNGSELWRVLGKLAAVHVAPLALVEGPSVSRSSRRLSSDLTRDRRAFAWAFKQLAGLAWRISL